MGGEVGGAVTEAPGTAVPVAETGIRVAAPAVETTTQVATPVAETPPSISSQGPQIEKSARDAEEIVRAEKELEDLAAADAGIDSAKAQETSEKGPQDPNAQGAQGSQAEEANAQTETVVSQLTTEQGISDEIANDSLYQKELGKAVVEAQKNAKPGEPLDYKKVSEKALESYNQEKAKPKPQETDPKEQRMQQLETRVQEMASKLEKTNAQLAKLTNLTQELVNYVRETDEKKKGSLLKTILMLLATVTTSFAVDMTRETSPVGQ